MKLPRIDQDSRKPSLINQIQKISAEQKYQQDELLPLPTNPDEFIARLDDLWYQTLMMKQEELQDAEAKYQQTLLIATVHEQHKVLVDFINDMRSEITELKNKQLQLLSEQEEYRKSVRDTVCDSMNDIYTVVEERQNTAFASITNELKKTIESMKTEIGKSVTTCRDEAEELRSAFRTSRTLSNGIDLFYFLAPASIIGYLIFKIVTFLT